ncbi:MAG: hypothetical protein IMZ43_01545 [Thermoplasmata archaeon]|nr:hypothetical protein [Thermoplasmata archaeon]
MQGSKVIRVYPEDLKKLDKINSERPQDISRADTFEYVLRVFEESPMRIEICKNVLAQRTGVESINVVTPSNLADKLRRDAIKAANEAPTKNNIYKESKE